MRVNCLVMTLLVVIILDYQLVQLLRRNRKKVDLEGFVDVGGVPELPFVVVQEAAAEEP
jgi:hypothetical protein